MNKVATPKLFGDYGQEPLFFIPTVFNLKLLKKLTAILLAFLFIVSPVTRALAQEAATDTTSSVPSIDVIPASPDTTTPATSPDQPTPPDTAAPASSAGSDASDSAIPAVSTPTDNQSSNADLAPTDMTGTSPTINQPNSDAAANQTTSPSSPSPLTGSSDATPIINPDSSTPATGAVVGVAGGVAAAGGALAVEAAAPVVSQVASDVVGDMSVGRSITGAAINVGAKALEGQVEHRKISVGEYLYAGATGAIGTSKYFDGLGPQAKFASSANLLGQGIFKGPKNVDWYSVGISGLSSGLTTKIMGIPSQNAVPQVYRFITEQVLVFTTDTAGQTINSGVQNSKK